MKFQSRRLLMSLSQRWVSPVPLLYPHISFGAISNMAITVIICLIIHHEILEEAVHTFEK